MGDTSMHCRARVTAAYGASGITALWGTALGMDANSNSAWPRAVLPTLMGRRRRGSGMCGL